MENYPDITPPENEEDKEGAYRACREFLTIYQPILTRIEFYLEQVIEQAGPAYAEAYRPWHKSLQDLLHGAYLTARKIPLPDPDAFVEALRMFSFESAIQFLRDICASCQIVLQHDWKEHFRKHIDTLLFSVAILNRQQQAVSL